MQSTLVNVQAVSGQGEVPPRDARSCALHSPLPPARVAGLFLEEKLLHQTAAGDGEGCAACNCNTTGCITAQLTAGGKGSNPKTTLYVGGLEENVNEAILNSAFIPFGEIKDVNIPLDHATGGQP